MAVIIRKPATVLDLGPVDMAALKERVGRISDRAWMSEDERKENRFSCFHHTRHIIFRFTPGNRDPEDFYEEPSWQVWRPLLEPVMRQAIAPYGFNEPEFPKAMLARLMAGSFIDNHIDGAGSNLRAHKIHVPLFTNPDALFFCSKEPFHLAEGRAWEVNNINSHGVVNRGAEDRIHFIFEVFDRRPDGGSEPASAG